MQAQQPTYPIISSVISSPRFRLAMVDAVSFRLGDEFLRRPFPVFVQSAAASPSYALWAPPLRFLGWLERGSPAQLTQ
jgi:hypothetical protein